MSEYGEDGIRTEIAAILADPWEESRVPKLVALVYRHRQAVGADGGHRDIVNAAIALSDRLTREFGELSNLVAESRRIRKDEWTIARGNLHADIQASVRALASAIYAEFGELSRLFTESSVRYRKLSPAERRCR